MTLEDKDILQMDATIIAGALVLLTVSSFATGSLVTQSILISITTVLVINFGVSAFSILWESQPRSFCPFCTWYSHFRNGYLNDNQREFSY